MHLVFVEVEVEMQPTHLSMHFLHLMKTLLCCVKMTSRDVEMMDGTLMVGEVDNSTSLGHVTLYLKADNKNRLIHEQLCSFFDEHASPERGETLEGTNMVFLQSLLGCEALPFANGLSMSFSKFR